MPQIQPVAAAATTPMRAPMDGGKAPGAVRVTDIRNVAPVAAARAAAGAMQREHVASAATSVVEGIGLNTLHPVFSEAGELTKDAIDRMNYAGLTPARATAGAYAMVACGVFAYLNTGDKALAKPHFEEMLTRGLKDLRADLQPGDALDRLRQGGLDVRADLFLQRDYIGQAANETSLHRHADVVTTHVFDGEESGLRAAIGDIRPGETAIVFDQTYHAFALTRDSAGWHVFDTALNPHKDVRVSAIEARFRGLVRPGLTTKDGNNHVHGREAEQLIAHYLDQVLRQPVLLRLAQPA